MANYNGFHVVADLYGCKNKAALNAINLRELRTEIVKAGMRVAKTSVYSFKAEDNSGSYSFTFILYESHVSCHTWPELNQANIDIYVCNYSKDNTPGALQVYEFMKKLYQPTKIKPQFVRRGKLPELNSSLFSKIVDFFCTLWKKFRQ